MKANYFLVIVFLATLLHTPSFASATFYCDYTNDTLITINDKIYWDCYFDNSTELSQNWKCLSYVMDNTSSVVQVNPNELVDKKNNVYLQDYFSSENGHILVYFTNENLFNEKNYTFQVSCNNNVTNLLHNYSVVMNVSYNDVFWQQSTNKVIYLKDNLEWVGLALGLLLAGLLTWGVIKWTSKKLL